MVARPAGIANRARGLLDTTSGKAREYGKPVISADEFFPWVGVD